MTVNFQMLGNAALMALSKVAFLSSRSVAPAAVMRCYDWDACHSSEVLQICMVHDKISPFSKK